MNALESEDVDPPPTVIGIGASAGGLSALKTFFAQVPADSGLAFVIVVHLSSEHESHLDEVLQPHTRLPVLQVTETVSLERNRVYLIPPGANLEAIDSHLRLTEIEKQRRHRAPVDHFFRTLAKTHDGHAIAVILSGSGSDGALGVKAVKEGGGFAIAQDPNASIIPPPPKSPTKLSGGSGSSPARPIACSAPLSAM
jgi:two-component system CheB/CheR fusion protein